MVITSLCRQHSSNRKLMKLVSLNWTWLFRRKRSVCFPTSVAPAFFSPFVFSSASWRADPEGRAWAFLPFQGAVESDHSSSRGISMLLLQTLVTKSTVQDLLTAKSWSNLSKERKNPVQRPVHPSFTYTFPVKDGAAPKSHRIANTMIFTQPSTFLSFLYRTTGTMMSIAQYLEGRTEKCCFSRREK